MYVCTLPHTYILPFYLLTPLGDSPDLSYAFLVCSVNIASLSLMCRQLVALAEGTESNFKAVGLNLWFGLYVCVVNKLEL